MGRIYHNKIEKVDDPIEKKAYKELAVSWYQKSIRNGNDYAAQALDKLLKE